MTSTPANAGLDGEGYYAGLDRSDPIEFSPEALEQRDAEYAGLDTEVSDALNHLSYFEEGDERVETVRDKLKESRAARVAVLGSGLARERMAVGFDASLAALDSLAASLAAAERERDEASDALQDLAKDHYFARAEAAEARVAALEAALERLAALPGVYIDADVAMDAALRIVRAALAAGGGTEGKS